MQPVNARDVWSIVKAARGAHLLINTCPPVVNKIVLRATLRLRANYHFPHEIFGVHPPESLPRDIRRAILHDVRLRGIRLIRRVTAIPTLR